MKFVKTQQPGLLENRRGGECDHIAVGDLAAYDVLTKAIDPLMHLGHEFVEMRASLVHDQALLKKHIHQHGLAAPDVAVNIKAARRRLVLVREQPAKQALLAQGLVARKLLLEAREGFGGLGLRGVGFNRAGGDEGLIMGAERGGWCVQHGPLTALGQRKLQAGIWGWGYAGARIEDAATFRFSIAAAPECWVARSSRAMTAGNVHVCRSKHSARRNPQPHRARRRSTPGTRTARTAMP